MILYPMKIGYIDIGNYGSAIVEVRVGRSSWPRNKEYLTLLPAVTMMSQADSRAMKNRTSVRMFNIEHLNVAARQDKWDRIKIVCFQPYRRDVPFGLSFVRFRTPSKDDDLVLEAQSKSEMKDLIFPSTSKQSPKTDISLLRKQRPLSRSARLLLAAATSPKLKIERTSKPKATMAFENEVNIFLLSLDLHLFDLENTTIRTIRHKFEFKNGRKLSQDEKALFIKLVRDFVDNLESCKLSDKSSNSSPSSKNTKSRARNMLALEDARPKNQKVMNFEKDQNISFAKTSTQENNQQSSYKEKDLSNKWNRPSRRYLYDRKTSKAKAKLNTENVSDIIDLTLDSEDNMSSNEFNLSSMEIDSDGPSPASSSKDTEHPDIKFHIPEDIDDFIEPPCDPETYFECPICSDLISSKEIEEHVDLCLERKEEACQSTSFEDISLPSSSGNSSQQTSGSWVECPICSSLFEDWRIEIHASQCVDDITF